MTKTSQDQFLQQFAMDVESGLSAVKKQLSSRYFYDATGDKLFQKIMQLPEYYLTGCEYEILQIQRQEILNAINPGEELQLMELGAGDGYKTRLLLDHFLRQGVNFRYVPVDISGDVLLSLENQLSEEFPELKVHSINKEYFSALEEMEKIRNGPLLILFLGSNIGNFTPDRADDFFRQLNQMVQSGDKLLTGIDLKKDPHTILRAYNDKTGVTKEFNLNLLKRINRELGGNFDLDQWQHFPVYDPRMGEARSYLISNKDQEVYIDACSRTFRFKKHEEILMEVSRKFDLEEIEELAIRTGFRIQKHFTDSRTYFSDSLWVKE